MNPIKSSFTIHGFERLQGRTALEAVDVDSRISEGLAINVGTELRTNRVHWLIWSVEDKECFVVVRDEVTREVVTVLTLEYYENLAWPVDPMFILMAERYASARDKSTFSEADLPILATESSGFRLVCDVVARPLFSGRTHMRRVDPRLDMIKNFDKPWEEAAFLEIFFKKFKIFRGKPVLLEQVFAKLNRSCDAFKTFTPKVTIQIPKVPKIIVNLAPSANVE